MKCSCFNLASMSKHNVSATLLRGNCQLDLTQSGVLGIQVHFFLVIGWQFFGFTIVRVQKKYYVWLDEGWRWNNCKKARWKMFISLFAWEEIHIRVRSSGSGKFAADHIIWLRHAMPPHRRQRRLFIPNYVVCGNLPLPDDCTLRAWPHWKLLLAFIS